MMYAAYRRAYSARLFDSAKRRLSVLIGSDSGSVSPLDRGSADDQSQDDPLHVEFREQFQTGVSDARQHEVAEQPANEKSAKDPEPAQYQCTLRGMASRAPQF